MNSDDVLRRLSFGIKKNSKVKKAGLETASNERKLRLSVVPEELKHVLRAKGRQDDEEDAGTASSSDSDSTPIADAVILTNSSLVGDVNAARQGKKRKRKQRKATAQLSDAQRAEAVSRLRRLNRIYAWGEKVADPILDWTDLSLPPQLLHSLQDFGIGEPTPIQMQSIPIMRLQRDLLASAPTGSGKTLAFSLPLILDVLRLKKLSKYSGGGHLFAIVLEPTHELAHQTYRELLKFSHGLGVECCLLGEGGSAAAADIVVCTPNRIIYSLSSLQLGFLRWLVVDESDRLFDAIEGGERCFRSQLATIYKATEGSKWLHRAFFSATFSYEVEEWCKENQPNIAMVCIGERNSANTSVEQELVFTGSEQGKVVALRDLLQQCFAPPALIFVQSKDRARQLMEVISSLRSRIPAALISSERSHSEREASLAALREGRLWLLVCTDLLGRGLDLPTVNLVVNFDLPTSIVSYIHRIGRTGRAGRPGRAVTYFTEADMAIIRPIALVIQQAGFTVPPYTLTLKAPSKNEKKDLMKRAPRRKDLATAQRKKRRVSQGEKERVNQGTGDKSKSKMKAKNGAASKK